MIWKIQIVEGSTLRTSVLAELHLPIPEAGLSLEKCEAAGQEFSSQQEVAHGHAGLGSGRHFSSLADNSKLDSDFTRGQLYVRLGWGKDQQGVLAPPAELLQTRRTENKVGGYFVGVLTSVFSPSSSITSRTCLTLMTKSTRKNWRNGC